MHAALQACHTADNTPQHQHSMHAFQLSYQAYNTPIMSATNLKAPQVLYYVTTRAYAAMTISPTCQTSVVITITVTSVCESALTCLSDCPAHTWPWRPLAARYTKQQWTSFLTEGLFLNVSLSTPCASKTSCCNLQVYERKQTLLSSSRLAWAMEATCCSTRWTRSSAMRACFLAAA